MYLVYFSDAVLNTMDPDRWFSSKPDLQKSFQEELQACNDTDTISLLSVLLVAAREMVLTKRDEAAIEYIEKRVSISST